MRVYHIILILLVAACTAQAEPVPIGFDKESLLRRRLDGPQEVAVPRAEDTTGVVGVPIIVTIAEDGRVTDARPDSQWTRESNTAPAIAAARRWRFRPFTYRGRPVVAQGTVEIAYRGPELWGDRTAQFPPVDYASLRIELVRSACYGECPDYSVSIDGAGNVLFSTRTPPLEGDAAVHRQYGGVPGVLVPGVHRSRIDRATLDVLIARFREARFFTLRPEYRAGITDSSTYRLRFSSGGRTWTVTDYVGGTVGMPAVVTALEDEVDRVAGTARWTDGGEGTVAALRSEGFDFTSRRAMQMAAIATLLRLAPSAPDRFVIELVEAGVPLDRTLGTGTEAVPLGEVLLLGAVRNHRPDLFAYLAGKGWLTRIPRDRLSLAFAEGGGGCEPAVARALVGAGADPMARTPRATDPELADNHGGTALIIATGPYGPCSRSDIIPLIESLIALGVDVNAADQKGETALFGIENPEIQERLLAAGARADVRDSAGNSPAFSSWTDVIVLRLLDAGADPNGRYDDGLSLRQQARVRHMPAVVAWLDARGIAEPPPVPIRR